MHSERQALVFQQQAFMAGHEVAERCACGRQLHGFPGSERCGGVGAELRSMLAGSRQGWLAEESVDVGNGAAADECQRTLRAGVQRPYHLPRMGGHARGGRRRREWGQRSIDVEKVRPREVGGRRYKHVVHGAKRFVTLGTGVVACTSVERVCFVGA